MHKFRKLVKRSSYKMGLPGPVPTLDLCSRAYRMAGRSRAGIAWYRIIVADLGAYHYGLCTCASGRGFGTRSNPRSSALLSRLSPRRT